MNKLIIILTVLLFSCGQEPESASRVENLPYYNEATFTAHWIDKGDTSLDSFHKISSFNLTNQDGNSVTEKTFEGKIYVADFFFTTCGGICPKMTSNMKILQEEFKDDNEVLLLSHSVTPDRDSVEVLKHYATNKGVISDKWHLVTGSIVDIYTLGREDYFIEEDLGLKKNADDFLHTENFVLIDKNRHIRGIYNGLNKTSIRQLSFDIQTLKKEG